MTTMIEALKQAIALADILPPAPGEEANPADILATYAKGAIAEYDAALAARDGELAAMLEANQDASELLREEGWEDMANHLNRAATGARGERLAALLMETRRLHIAFLNSGKDALEFGKFLVPWSNAVAACYPENG